MERDTGNYYNRLCLRLGVCVRETTISFSSRIHKVLEFLTENALVL